MTLLHACVKKKKKRSVHVCVSECEDISVETCCHLPEPKWPGSQECRMEVSLCRASHLVSLFPVCISVFCAKWPCTLSRRVLKRGDKMILMETVCLFIQSFFHSSSVMFWLLPSCHQVRDGIRPGHIISPLQGQYTSTQSCTLEVGHKLHSSVLSWIFWNNVGLKN